MIHYHGLPLSGEKANILAMRGKHCMVSYANPHSIAEAAELCQSFVLDNGAFSAWKSGKAFDLEGFAEWASLWAHHPACDWFCLPDDIGGGEDENQLIRARFSNLVDARTWSKGIPIWHMHESLDVLQTFTCWTQPWLAIGSSGEYADVGSPSWWCRIAEAMEVLCDEDGIPKKRIHGLRMLDPTIFSHIPLSSADSTNVSRNIGIDKQWDNAPYAPKSRMMRALIMAERIEIHASASRWNFETVGIQKNMDLLG